MLCLQQPSLTADEGRGSGHLIKDIFIDCPPSRIWRLIEKHLEHPEVSPIEQDPGKIKEVRGEPLTAQRSGVGAQTRWFYEYKGKPFVWDDVVTEWEPGRRVVWEATSAWEMEDSFSLIPEGKGTRVRYEMDYRLPYGPMGWLYGKLFLETRMEKHLEGVLQRMKRACEKPFE